MDGVKRRGACLMSGLKADLQVVSNHQTLEESRKSLMQLQQLVDRL